MILHDNFTIRTSHPEMYQELQQNKKLFELQIHIFVSALAIGILNNLKSQESPHRDIIKLWQLKDNLKEYRDMINIISQIICEGKNERDCSHELLAYADGGLEFLWKEYQAQGTLDLPRILEEAKKKWSKRIPELLASLRCTYASKSE